MSEYKSEENWLNNAPLTVVDVDSLHFCLESQEGTFPDACIATNFSLNENGDIM